MVIEFIEKNLIESLSYQSNQGLDSYKSFEELECWKSARLLRLLVSKTAKALPKSEEYKLKDQLIRSSRSVAANIAEGFGRYSYKDNVRCCCIARGSLTETLDHMIVAFDETYIDEFSFKEFRKLFEKTLKLLNGYISYLRNAGKLPPDFDPAK